MLVLKLIGMMVPFWEWLSVLFTCGVWLAGGRERCIYGLSGLVRSDWLPAETGDLPSHKHNIPRNVAAIYRTSNRGSIFTEGLNRACTWWQVVKHGNLVLITVRAVNDTISPIKLNFSWDRIKGVNVFPLLAHGGYSCWLIWMCWCKHCDQ